MFSGYVDYSLLLPGILVIALPLMACFVFLWANKRALCTRLRRFRMLGPFFSFSDHAGAHVTSSYPNGNVNDNNQNFAHLTLASTSRSSNSSTKKPKPTRNNLAIDMGQSDTIDMEPVTNSACHNENQLTQNSAYKRQLPMNKIKRRASRRTRRLYKHRIILPHNRVLATIYE